MINFDTFWSFCLESPAPTDGPPVLSFVFPSGRVSAVGKAWVSIARAIAAPLETMTVQNLSAQLGFITKDGSTTRSILDRTKCARTKPKPSSPRAAGQNGTTQDHGGVLFHPRRRGRDRARRRTSHGRPGRLPGKERKAGDRRVTFVEQRTAPNGCLITDIMKGTHEKHNAHSDTRAPFHHRSVRLQHRSQLRI